MSLNTKEIKARIGGVKNTKKISKAMEMISVAKMNKSIARLKNIEDYRASLVSTLSQIEFPENYTHPLLETSREKGDTAVLLISANRGLCGSLNSNITKLALGLVEEDSDQYQFIAVGKKSAKNVRNAGGHIVELYQEFDELNDFDDILPITQSLLQGLNQGAYSSVKVVYTEFTSIMLQTARMVDLLPLKIVDEHSDASHSKVTPKFEPDKSEVLNQIIPRIFEVEIYHALISAIASEHASRMVAMQNATKAAEDFIADLTLEYNKARQAAITQEIAEIVAPISLLED